MTIDDAIQDLLDVSTDITAVAVLDGDGAVVASGPGVAGEMTAEATGRLWAAAERRAARDGGTSLDHVVVRVPDGAVALVDAHGHRAVGVTGPRPAVALLLFDLRTCLDDAYATTEARA